MNDLQTNNLIALSLLLDEEIYNVEEKELLMQKPPLAQPLPTETTETKEATAFKYLGDNNKYILIVVKEPDDEFLKQDDLDFLQKILKARKLELNDVAIINTEKNKPLYFDDLKTYFAFNKILTFGIDPRVLQINSAQANKKSLFKGIPVLGTWELTKLADDEKKKTIFWNEFKTF